MRRLIESEGAELSIIGTTWQEANEFALKEAIETGAVYVSPFDDPFLWDGHASLISESVNEIDEPDFVIAAVGGGGLFCGIMQGIQNANWTKTRVLACETQGAASLTKSILAGHRITLETIDTIATSLGAKKVSEKAFEFALAGKTDFYTCSDRQAMLGVKEIANVFNTLVEPACGAAVSAVLEQPTEIKDAKSILVILCGGAAMDLEIFKNYASMLQISY